MKTAELLTVDEVAERVKCHPHTVRRWIWSGKLAFLRVGGLVRVSEDEVVRFLESGRAAARKAPKGVDALRAVMRSFEDETADEDVEMLERLIGEGEQPAKWDPPLD